MKIYKKPILHLVDLNDKDVLTLSGENEDGLVTDGLWSGF